MVKAIKKGLKFLGKMFMYYIGVCILVQLMCMSGDIGGSSGNTYVAGKEGTRWSYPKFPRSKFKSPEMPKFEFPTYEAPKVEWVETEKTRIENFK